MISGIQRATATPLERLAAAAREIVGASTVEELLAVVGEAARALVETEAAAVRRAADAGWETGALCVPLIAGDGTRLGMIEVSQKPDGAVFTAEDEILLQQLASMAAGALQRIELSATLHGALARLGLALEASQTGTWDWDLATGAVRWSDALAHIYGLAPGTFPGTFDAYLEAAHPDDRAEVARDITRAAETRSRFTYRYRILRPDGHVRWIEGAGMPVVEADGTMTAITGACVDITERHETEQRLRRDHRLIETLNQVGQAVTSRLELKDIVQAVTDAAAVLTPAQFGAFFYNVINENGEAYQLYTLSGAAREAFSRFPMPRATEIFRPTFEGHGTVLLDDVTTDPRYGKNGPYHGMPEGHLPVRSYLAVPVVLASGEVAGGLFLGHPDPGQFLKDDGRLVEGIAAYAAIAIENARLFEAAQRELGARNRALQARAQVATVLQESLLPPELPHVPGLRIAARYRPGAAEVGGDYYDVFPVRGRSWGFVIGDVCGKGPRAAAHTALARHTIHTAAVLQRGTRPVLGVLNRVMLERDEPDTFHSALFGRIRPSADGATVEMASAGHPYPMVRRNDGTVETIPLPGILLGVVPEPVLKSARIMLASGELLLLYTDGVTESRRGTDQFGEDRLKALLAETGDAYAGEVADAIEAAVLRYRDDRRADDCALLVLQADVRR